MWSERQYTKALLEHGVPALSYYAEAELETEFAQERYAYLKLLADDDDRVALRWLVGLYGSNWHAAGYRRVRRHCEGSRSFPLVSSTELKLGGDAPPPIPAGL